MKKIFLILFYLTITFTHCIAKSQTIKPYKIFLLGGQSNMDGCGTHDELPEKYQKHPENVVTWDQQIQEWVPLNEDSFAKVRDHLFGPEVTFSHALAGKFPDHTIAIIKTSAGGTTLFKHWVPGKKMYARFLEKMNDGTQQLKEKGIDYEICGMLWMQGEGDTETTEMANAYANNLMLMIEDVRTRTGKENLPFVMGRISTSLMKDTPWEFTYLDIVRAAQEKVASIDPHVYMISTDKFATLEDNTHFNTEGQIKMGKHMAKAMLRELK
jgi:hypothetical protein